ncbi:hypothetical protein [Mesorhizobium japonicum]|uniref:Mll4030 protein n=1 Tax=Mesorhizobium japonicum (strain LMG 29417 / CECT 9101 / MAFF 303099) TaxID=266835 RepID=Q98EY2_RHILO|nr:hypothetical protein [Mesorhizobium japonicum]BAB50785.1 mll4030 [Mesorhizobium japonicum MAFF 303099]
MTDETTSEFLRKIQGEVASLVAGEVEVILAQYNDGMRRQGRISAGLVSGLVAAAMLSLPRKQHQAIYAMQGELGEFAKKFVAELAKTAMTRFRDESDQEQPKPDHAILHEEQKNELSAMVIENWAGPVAGPTFLEATFGIPRSTLYRWQRRSEVIALLKGRRKFVFPLTQFVDGRPAKGIGDVLSIIGHPRTAWFWLTHPCTNLGGRLPIEMLRMDMVDAVVAAARDDPVANPHADA